jgi:hypothetical protein
MRSWVFNKSHFYVLNFGTDDCCWWYLLWFFYAPLGFPELFNMFSYAKLHSQSIIRSWVFNKSHFYVLNFGIDDCRWSYVLFFFYDSLYALIAGRFHQGTFTQLWNIKLHFIYFGCPAWFLIESLSRKGRSACYKLMTTSCKKSVFSLKVFFTSWTTLKDTYIMRKIKTYGGTRTLCFVCL